MLVVLCLVLVTFPNIAATPAGCTYDSVKLLYTCSGRAWSLPLAFTDFSVQPQRLLLTNVAGELPSAAPTGPTFSGFGSMNTASFDSRFSPSLTIICYPSESVYFSKNTFSDFGWIEEFAIKDCDILSLPVSVFEYFGDLNSFTIKGGSATALVADSLLGINIKKSSTSPVPKGELVFKDTTMTSGQLPVGMLYSINNVTSIVLDSLQLTTLSLGTFYNVPHLEFLSLSHNNFTAIPESLFSKTTKLSTVRIYGIQWDCSCANLWFLPYSAGNNITLEGDFICSTPSGYTNKTAAKFYTENCISHDLCEGHLGLVLFDMCFKAIDMVSYILFLPIAAMTAVSFSVAVCLFVKRRKHKEAVVETQKLQPLAPITKEDRFAMLMKAKMADNDHEEDTTQAPKSFSKNWRGAKRKLALMHALGKVSPKKNPTAIGADEFPEEIDEDEQYNEHDDDFEDISNERSEKLDLALQQRLKALENIQQTQGIWVAPPRQKRAGLAF